VTGAQDGSQPAKSNNRKKSGNRSGKRPSRPSHKVQGKDELEDVSTKPGMAARLVATSLVTRVVDDGRNLDALCDREHGVRSFLSLEPRDRSLARAIAVTALRNRKAIQEALNRLWDRPPPKRARFLHHMLHVALAQMLYLDLPDRAAVDLAVSAIGNDERTTRFRALANAVLRRATREKEKIATRTDNMSPFPKWFEQALRRDYGKEKAAGISSYVSREAMMDITVKSNPVKWAEKLDGILLPTGSVRLPSSVPVETMPGFADGEWWVQDAAAALPARLIDAGPGAQVLELCAAPGGKTAQLCNFGYDVTALDISRPRLSRLEKNLNRLNFTAKLVEADILEWQPEERFDAVLLDAPCSSTGTIRRHPDVIWTRSADEVRELAELQIRLVKKAIDFVKPGGNLVFSNCSLFKQEGENLLVRLLETCDQIELSPILAEEIPGLEMAINGQGALRTLPQYMQVAPSGDTDPIASGGIDGFFACRLTIKTRA
jgi:16S rRNA (cytosine967-C5)-methyltransferase